MLNSHHQWFLIETEREYRKAMQRYEEVKYAKKGTKDHKEKLLLAKLISEYEEKKWEVPEVDPIQLIITRMEEFGYKPVDLARFYGDKGTISKVLRYKQPLSLNMIRIFSKELRIPADELIEEYALHP
ncbi:transcriptional regulator [Compostibacter hankyongensis]|uniref:XRE family transcriptional regulator n=1 Tax=Compostibacter hankyongensis TaxID=1007089 RepID=A0ABP8G245_9BACT